MMTSEEREFLEGHIAGLSDAEKHVFRELLIFMLDNPGSGSLLTPAREAGCESWAEDYAYILDNYEREADPSIQ